MQHSCRSPGARSKSSFVPSLTVYAESASTLVAPQQRLAIKALRDFLVHSDWMNVVDRRICAFEILSMFRWPVQACVVLVPPHHFALLICCEMFSVLIFRLQTCYESVVGISELFCDKTSHMSQEIKERDRQKVRRRKKGRSTRWAPGLLPYTGIRRKMTMGAQTERKRSYLAHKNYTSANILYDHASK